MNIKIKENLKKTFYFLLLFSLGIVFLVSLLSSTSQDNTFLKFNSSLNESKNIMIDYLKFSSPLIAANQN